MDPTSAAISLDLMRLRAAYQGGTTAEAVMAALLARMTDPAVWISRVPDDVLLAQARTAELSLPLGGVPFAVKDNIDVAGLPTTAGFNNLVGLKPTRGWLSTTGVVPACGSLDYAPFAEAAGCSMARGLPNGRPPSDTCWRSRTRCIR